MMNTKTAPMAMPIWPGLDTSARLQRRLTESRKANDAMQTKQILREVGKIESRRREPMPSQA